MSIEQKTEVVNLSPHFTLKELTESSKAKELNIDNTPSQKEVDNLIKLCRLLEAIRAIVGKPINISSGFRSTKLNEATKGSKTSAHLLGLATDINVNGISPRKLCKLIADHNLDFDQLILEDVKEDFPDGKWVHIGLSETKNRGQCLTMKGGKYFTGFIK